MDIFWNYTLLTNHVLPMHTCDRFFYTSNYNFVLFDLFEFVASSTNATESSHGADAWPNADTPRTTTPPKSTAVLPSPKTHENSKTSKCKQSSNVRLTSRGSHDSTNDRTWTWTALHSPRAEPTVSSTACKCVSWLNVIYILLPWEVRWPHG